MRLRSAVFVVLVGCIFMVSGFARENTLVHHGKLVVLQTPEMGSGFAVVLYLDDKSAVDLGAGSMIGLWPQNCKGRRCVLASKSVSDLLQNCIYHSYCSSKVEVIYQVWPNKCSDGSDDCVGVNVYQYGDMWNATGRHKTNTEAVKRYFQMIDKSIAKSDVPPENPEAWDDFMDNARMIERYRRSMKDAELNLARDRVTSCLRRLQIGDSSEAVYRCGSPDHTNSDLYMDQLIYPDGISVYIDKSSNKVENVQWAH